MNKEILKKILCKNISQQAIIQFNFGLPVKTDLVIEYIYRYFVNNGTKSHHIESIQLVKRDPKMITEKDALFIARKLNNGQFPESDITIKQIEKEIEDHYSVLVMPFTDPGFRIASNTLSPIVFNEIWQYLLDKGYDLPEPLLDNKTLFEAGLAIYE